MSTSKIEVARSGVHYPFWFGGSAAAIATCFTHPLELSKFTLRIALLCIALADSIE